MSSFTVNSGAATAERQGQRGLREEPRRPSVCRQVHDAWRSAAPQKISGGLFNSALMRWRVMGLGIYNLEWRRSMVEPAPFW